MSTRTVQSGGQGQRARCTAPAEPAPEMAEQAQHSALCWTSQVGTCRAAYPSRPLDPTLPSVAVACVCVVVVPTCRHPLQLLGAHR